MEIGWSFRKSLRSHNFDRFYQAIWLPLGIMYCTDVFTVPEAHPAVLAFHNNCVFVAGLPTKNV